MQGRHLPAPFAVFSPFPIPFQVKLDAPVKVSIRRLCKKSKIKACAIFEELIVLSCTWDSL